MWLITRHVSKLELEHYWGSEEYVNTANEIYDLSLAYGIVKQSWYDDRLKATDTELMCELLYVLGANYMYEETKEILDKELSDEEYA